MSGEVRRRIIVISKALGGKKKNAALFSMKAKLTKIRAEI